MTDDSPKPPRFPYIILVLFVVAAGVAALLWVRYSWLHVMSPDEVAAQKPERERKRLLGPSLLGRYVEMEGIAFSTSETPCPRMPDDVRLLYSDLSPEGHAVVCLKSLRDKSILPKELIYVYVPVSDALPRIGDRVTYTGRLEVQTQWTVWLPWYFLHARQGRLTAPSVGGVVVAAFWAVILALSLVTWRARQKAWRGVTAGDNPGMERASND